MFVKKCLRPKVLLRATLFGAFIPMELLLVEPEPNPNSVGHGSQSKLGVTARMNELKAVSPHHDPPTWFRIVTRRLPFWLRLLLPTFSRLDAPSVAGDRCSWDRKVRAYFYEIDSANSKMCSAW
jgi:hypothetical protein